MPHQKSSSAPGSSSESPEPFESSEPFEPFEPDESFVPDDDSGGQLPVDVPVLHAFFASSSVYG